MDKKNEVLCASGLSFSYKRTQALKNVSFSVEEGTIHGFVGPNGAGKTTALKIFATLLKPGRGSVRVNGLDIIWHYKKVRRIIGFMPDHLSLYRQMTVFEYLDFFGAAYGLTSAKRKQTVQDIIALTEMDAKKDDFIHALSRGQQQRVLLARVLVHDPKLLLLDEPASGLDPRARIELMEILKELKRMGKTIFISSHILSELGEICDSVTILDRGEVKFSGRMRDLQEYRGEIQRNILLLAKPHPETAEALRSLEGISTVEADEDGEKFIIEFNSSALHSNDILKKAIESGAEIASYREDVQHLNQAFMQLTESGVK